MRNPVSRVLRGSSLASAPPDPSRPDGQAPTGLLDRLSRWAAGDPRSPGGAPGDPAGTPRPRRFRGFWWLVVAALAFNWFVASAVMAPAPRAEVPYTFFTEQLGAGNVDAIYASGDTIEGTFKAPVEYAPEPGVTAQVESFSTQRPSFAEDDLLGALDTRGVTVYAENPDAGPPLLVQLLLGFGPVLLLVGLLVWFQRRSAAAAAGSGLGGFGKSKAARYQPGGAQRTTFADVAGIDDVKSEVTEIVDFLKNTDRYRRLGARIPRGVLLSGPPGTGKTLLARAVAGEAGVPFFSISASEFIEAIVGVGASRVRDLFDQAKKVAPAIVFIDELDAIGRARGGGSFSTGGSDEREQTLNQILTEMDGFAGDEGVVVLAATNRPEILDPALLRPGRFDRRVAVSPPDLGGRLQILRVHTRGVPLAADVDLSTVAAVTPGMVGADLANLVNEAALTAAKNRHEQVTGEDFGQALEKIQLGTVRGIVLSTDEMVRTAYHESGHALLGMLTPGADPVRRVTIIPRGQALGVTVQTPEADRYGYSEVYLRGRLAGALGGRAAEEVAFDDVTTGAENDLQQATQIARQMVGRWGMSPAVGPVAVFPPSGQEQPFGVDGVAPGTRQLVDDEVRRLLEESYEAAVTTLRVNRDRLDKLAHRLLERESLDEDEAYAAAEIPRAALAAMAEEASRPR